MSTTLRMAALAALSVALIWPVPIVAFADDESAHDALIRQASAPPAPTVGADSRVASTMPIVEKKSERDLIGDGGKQDALANEIYQPGHTVGVGE